MGDHLEGCDTSLCIRIKCGGHSRHRNDYRRDHDCAHGWRWSSGCASLDVRPCQAYACRHCSRDGGSPLWKPALSRAFRSMCALIPHHFCVKPYLRFHIKKIQICKNRGKGMIQSSQNNRIPFELVRKKRFNLKQGFFLSLIRAFGFSGALTLFVILFFVVYNGIGILSWEFITQPPLEAMTKGGIFPVIVGTVLLTAICMIIVIPIGVTTAIFLAEYSKPGLFHNMVMMSIYTLAGVPSVVFGLFGLAVFVVAFNFGMSLLAGSLTLAIMALPYIISTSEEAIKAVPYSFREASLACGATKWQTIRKMVLPTAMPGILTGVILGTAKVSGENAPLMFTAAAFFTPGIPRSLFEPVMALPYHIYVLATAGTFIEETRPIQYGTALTLIILVFGMNLLGILLRARKRGKKAW